MSELPESLVRQLAASGQSVVYLPPNAQRGSSTATSERNAADPSVLAAAQDYFDSPDKLHGDRVSETTIINEKPVHRMMIFASASGSSAEDIAAQTGYTSAAVRQVLRQPWARARLVQILNELGRDRVVHFLKNEVTPSLETLQAIRDDRAVVASARITAANSILDRALGKATIHVESKSTISNVPVEAARIDAELASVRKQLEAKGVDVGASSN